MKVLIISTQFPPRTGGVGVAVLRLAGALIDRGHSVLVVTRNNKDLSTPGLGQICRRQEFGLDVITFPDRWFKRQAYGLCLASLRNYCAAFRPEVIHAYYAYPAGYLAISCGREFDVPTIVSCRGDDVTKGVVDRASTLRLCLENADATTFVSRSLLSWASLICRPSRPYVVHNSIGEDFIAPLARSEQPTRSLLEIPQDTIIIGANALFRWKKGIEYLLEILRLIARSSLPNITFALIGSFDKDLRQRVEELGIGENRVGCKRTVRVISKPSRQDLPLILGALDLFLLTSVREGMPNALLEAMLCETCVAATAVNGCLEILSVPEMGILLDPYDPLKGYEALLPLLADREMLKLYGANARKHVLSQFALTNEVNAYERIYADVQ